MNIETRIKKLEKTNNPNGVCDCRIRRTEIYLQDLSASSTDTEPRASGEPVPGVCPACRKPIEKQMLIIQAVDHSTKTRFPAEWQ